MLKFKHKKPPPEKHNERGLQPKIDTYDYLLKSTGAKWQSKNKNYFSLESSTVILETAVKILPAVIK